MEKQSFETFGYWWHISLCHNQPKNTEGHYTNEGHYTIMPQYHIEPTASLTDLIADPEHDLVTLADELDELKCLL